MSLTEQKAIVKKVRRDANRRTSKFIIPGGTNLMVEPLKKGEFAKYLHTWLRAVKAFDEFTLSFVKDVTQFATSTERIITFPEGKLSTWENAQKGRKWVADQVADALFNASKPPVVISIKREGIYFTYDNTKTVKPGCEAWQPYYEVLKSREGEMNLE